MSGLRGEEARKSAMQSLVALLEENLAVEIDWWALLNLEGFRNVVDIFGGVDIEIAVDMEYNDPEQSLIIDLTPGKHTLNGYESEQFVRFREGYKTADKGRINAQKIFISAFIDTVKRKLNVSMIDDLLKEAQNNILTDIPLLDCAYFARAALTALNMEDIYMVTLPSEGVVNEETGAWYEVIFRADTLALINRHFNVFTADVTDELFDAKGIFTNADKAYIEAVYRTPAGTAAAGASAASIEDGMVEMQRDLFYSEYLD